MTLLFFPNLTTGYYYVDYSGDNVGDTSVAQDLDSSFTVDILGRAGLSQFINTPKRKIQEIQLNKQALLRSIVEHATSTRVSVSGYL